MDHVKAVEKLCRLKQKNGETAAQLAWRIERNSWPKRTQNYVVQDTFIGAIDKEMSQRLKKNPKHCELNLTKLAEELERLELIYQPTTLN